MNELIEIRWTERLEQEIEAWIRDKAQFPHGMANSLMTAQSAEQFNAELSARRRVAARAIGALKEILTRHSQPATDVDIVARMEAFRQVVRDTQPPQEPEPVPPVETYEPDPRAERAARAQAAAARRTGETE
jgi:hypothetical protein